MIGAISGRVLAIGVDHVLVEAGGVGYEINCAPRTLAELPAVGNMATLFTDMQVREDSMQLFGFTSLYEREWHRLLVSVQGVGARVSLSILATLTARGVEQSLAIGDAASIQRAQGVGAKIAGRIVAELKDKMPAEAFVQAKKADLDSEAGEPTENIVSLSEVRKESMAGLLALGLDYADAANALSEAMQEMPDADAETLVKMSLQHIDRLQR